MRRAFPCTTICLSYHSHPIRPCGAPSPRGEGCDTGLPSTKKSGEAALVNLSAPQVPSSRAQPRNLYSRNLYCTAAICTHAPSLKRHLGASFFSFPSLTIYRSLAHDLPVCKKDPSTSVGMTGGRRVVLHSFSHRYVDPSCAFGAPLL